MASGVPAHFFISTSESIDHYTLDFIRQELSEKGIHYRRLIAFLDPPLFAAQRFVAAIREELVHMRHIKADMSHGRCNRLVPSFL
jgi:hypothetical protein